MARPLVLTWRPWQSVMKPRPHPESWWTIREAGIAAGVGRHPLTFGRVRATYNLPRCRGDALCRTAGDAVAYLEEVIRTAMAPQRVVFRHLRGHRPPRPA